MNKAYWSNDSLEKLRWVTAFLYSTLHLTMMQTKPFTPILGETSWIQVGDMNLYVENTVSKPPTLSFYGFAPYFKIHGHIALYAETGANSVTVKKKGKFVVEIKSNTNTGEKHIYTAQIPPLLANGIMVGKRTLNYYGNMIVSCLTTGNSAVIKFNPEKRGAIASFLGFNQKSFPDYCKGYITKTQNISIDQKSQNHKCNVKDKDIIENIEGEWTGFVQFSEKIYWIKEEYEMPKSYRPQFILPSDSSNRLDIKYFKEGNEEESQKWKEEYEKIQRGDREIRKKANKKKK